MKHIQSYAEHGRIIEELLGDGEASTRENFFNEKPPGVAIFHEKPEHRQMLWMKARGASNIEIATTMGYSAVQVSTIMRQPWARKYLLDEMSRAGVDEIDGILKGAAADSVYKLIELREDEKTPKAVQRQAAVDLLDRFLGKPTQRIEQQIEQKIDVTTVAEIDRELERLQAEEKVLLGHN